MAAKHHTNSLAWHTSPSSQWLGVIKLRRAQENLRMSFLLYSFLNWQIVFARKFRQGRVIVHDGTSGDYLPFIRNPLERSLEIFKSTVILAASLTLKRSPSFFLPLRGRHDCCLLHSKCNIPSWIMVIELQYAGGRATRARKLLLRRPWGRVPFSQFPRSICPTLLKFTKTSSQGNYMT